MKVSSLLGLDIYYKYPFAVGYLEIDNYLRNKFFLTNFILRHTP